MANERLPMRKIRDVLRLEHQGLSLRMIAASLSVARTTVRNYVIRAKMAGLSWPLPEDLGDEELEARLFPSGCDITDGQCLKRPMPDWSVIHKELGRPHVTLILLWEEYREQHPDGYHYSQFCEHYRRWRKQVSPAMRQNHVAGEKMFVDYAGSSISVIDPVTFEIRETQLFVATLGASSYTYAEATWTQGLADWTGSHVRAFAYFGGVPRQIIPDNLKSAVVKSCFHEPDINRTYADLARHYDTAVIPARPRKPKDKAKVEVAVQIAQRWILARLRHRTFTSLQELNTAIRELLEKLNARVTRHLGASRRELFEKTDRPALKALPADAYEYADWKQQRVAPDYHVTIDGHFYSVPERCTGAKLWIRATQHAVEVFDGGRRVACHIRSRHQGGRTTLRDHMPPAHRRYADWTPEKIKAQAAGIGPHTQALVDLIMREKRHPEQGFRACSGILRLAGSFGEDRLEAACKRAMEIGARSYSSVQSILGNNLDRVQPHKSEPETEETILHTNIRGSNYFH